MRKTHPEVVSATGGFQLMMSARRPRDSDDEQSTHDDPTPTVAQVRYGPGADRDLYVAVADVLAGAGVERPLPAVGSVVDLEAIQRLNQGGRFQVTVPVADGRLTITNATVRFERD